MVDKRLWQKIFIKKSYVKDNTNNIRNTNILHIATNFSSATLEGKSSDDQVKPDMKQIRPKMFDILGKLFDSCI